MSVGERVCVLFGGSSDERAISLRSGKAILDALKRQSVAATPLDARNGFKTKLKAEKPDLAFIAVHGRGGEDGAIQHVLETLRIPYVGSPPNASLLAFDKSKTKKEFSRSGIPTPPAVLLTKKNWQAQLKHISIPVVIKPTCNGSSIGVVMVEKLEELKQKIKSSIRCYSSILVEKKIEGREFTVGILGTKALPVIELRPKRVFYDFKAKYTKGLTEYLVPAPIDAGLSDRLQALAEKVHRVLCLRDFSRVDMMVDRQNQAYVLEVNTIPGFTETSLLPKAAQAVGIDFDHLCLKLLGLARERIKKVRT